MAIFTADMARNLSNRSYADEEFNERLDSIHDDIEGYARKGYRNTILWYTDHTETALDKAIVEHLRGEGFRFETFSEVIGGVRQHPAKYVCW